MVTFITDKIRHCILFFQCHFTSVAPSFDLRNLIVLQSLRLFIVFWFSRVLWEICQTRRHWSKGGREVERRRAEWRRICCLWWWGNRWKTRSLSEHKITFFSLEKKLCCTLIFSGPGKFEVEQNLWGGGELWKNFPTLVFLSIFHGCCVN